MAMNTVQTVSVILNLRPVLSVTAFKKYCYINIFFQALNNKFVLLY